MLVTRKKTQSIAPDLTQASQHQYKSESELFPQLTNPSLKDLKSDYWTEDLPQTVLEQLLESNRATTDFCYAIFKKLQEIERQNQMILDIFQGEMGCEEANVSFADEGLTDEQVKERVLAYYQTEGESYPSDVAYELNFDLERVVNAVYQLEAEGVLEG
ncbi:MAG: hypothetical protein XE11_1338 [Methanomicrobiales archaeon 53_19]|jgi:hypothetical protein|uniref:hypothetical protein n=1 Tax=Methanocalculus sp. TaxID=2004547 RepID=UPI00074908CB|nr:hypothetical protein [Methanocalculus sp.]KUL03246.1 MAG: hypothetical protein XE11_1338 [Methanomicrobiales archaeon 53_19]HIJ07250.1 hypothetical protein [Methanocalculus sp.]